MGVYVDLASTLTCGYLTSRTSLGIPFAFPKKTLTKEAKLASIVWLLSKFDAAKAGTVDEQVLTCESDVKRTMHDHPIGSETNISKTVATHAL